MTRHPPNGFILLVVLLLVLLLAAIAGYFLSSARTELVVARHWEVADQCLLDAQSALDQVKYGIVRSYGSNATASLQWFGTWNSGSIGASPAYIIPALAPINGSLVAVTIASVVIVTNFGYASVTLVGTATRSAPVAATRKIREVLRITPQGSTVMPFEYAYLLRSSGQLRNNMVINGDVRINGNFRLNASAVVNGSRYASGQLTANSPVWTVADYWAQAGVPARPTDPPSNGGIAWPMGFVPSKVKTTFLPEFAMPTIDNVDTLAASARGQISQNGVSLVVDAYSGPGPDNRQGTADDRCLILDGSVSPITVQGTVVVKGDLIIRGKVSGQATILAGRNVHIVGDLTYVNPPSWPKPDANPTQTAANNAGRGLLVLGAKGNIVVGNYTGSAWSNRVWSIMTASAVSRPVLASDAALGYDTDGNPANGYVFDGRYYVNEPNGGRRLSGVGTNTVPRKFFESSLASSTFSALCAPNNVPSINAALFSNHAIIGDLGSSAAGGNTMLNGALACHDELDAFYGTFTINWDIRLGSQSKERLRTYLTSGETGTVSTVVGWREVH